MRPAAALLVAALLACLPGPAAAREAAQAQPAPVRPNVVLIMAEDLGPRIGAWGDPVAHTPNIDRLAAEGVRYTRAFTTAGVCAPSRAAILMGVHQNTWGAGHMRAAAGGYVAVPPPGMKGFPELLRAAGYWVVNNGKTDVQLSTTLGGVFGGPASLWDEARAEDWRGRAPGQPFFAYLNLLETHESQVWPTFALGSFTQLVLAPMRIANHLGWPVETDPAAVRVPPYYPDTEVVRADLARHYNNIAHMDERVGEILTKLEADGVAARTLVIWTTDHGDGLPRAKRQVYDSGIHVPLVVRWPGHLPAGQVRGELVSAVDYAPTVLAAAGVAVPSWMQGRVLFGAGAGPPPAYVYAARDRMDEAPDTVRAVRGPRFAYLRNLRPEQPYVLPIAFRDLMPTMRELRRLHAEGALDAVQELWFRPRRPAEELYDTDADPDQVHDLAGDPARAGRLATMRAALDAWLVESGDLGLLPEAELRERFWPGGEQPATADPVIAFEAGRARLRCATPGASLEIRVGGGRWLLYTGSRRVPAGAYVAARAVRYGFSPSAEVSAQAP